MANDTAGSGKKAKAAPKPEAAPATPFPPASETLHRKGDWLWIPLRQEWRDVAGKRADPMAFIGPARTGAGSRGRAGTVVREELYSKGSDPDTGILTLHRDSFPPIWSGGLFHLCPPAVTSGHELGAASGCDGEDCQ